MKVEIIVDKDNTHFTYMYECDQVKDNSNMMSDGRNKLVLLRERTKAEQALSAGIYETVAVFATWTAWIKLPDDAEKCERCGRYKIINKKGYCSECQAHNDRKI